MYFGLAKQISDYDKSIFEQVDAYFINITSGEFYKNGKLVESFVYKLPKTKIHVFIDQTTGHIWFQFGKDFTTKKMFFEELKSG